MPYEPRLKNEILADLASAMVARSQLSDVAKGSAALSILGAFAEELEGIEFRIKTIRDSFTLEGSTGTDLDERVSDLPGDAVTRLGPSAAAGAVLRIKRSLDPATGLAPVAPLLVPAGTLYGRTSEARVTYVQTADVTIAGGQLEYPVGAVPLVNVVANSHGPLGNCGAGSIDIIKTGPSTLEQVFHVTSISSGMGTESDESLRKRALLFIAGLARCNPEAIEALARGFTSSEGIQVRDAALFEDPTRPGITYVTIDDGTGFDGFKKPGKITTGTVPTGTAAPIVIYHEGPATGHIEPAQFNLKPVGQNNFQPAPTNADGSPRWVSVHERGILYPDATLLGPGDEWRIVGYEVFTGPVAELQGIVEGSPADFLSGPGYRAAGTRVIVQPSNVTYISTMTVNIGVETGAVFSDVEEQIKAEISDYFKTLGPGETFYKPVLYQHILNVMDDKLVTVEILIPTANSVSVEYDKSLRILEEAISVV